LFSQNWISQTGVFIVTGAAISWVVLLPVTLRRHAENPYVGILGFLILPAAFVAGLLLIPLGIVIYKARLRRRGPETGFAAVAADGQGVRRLLKFVAATTAVNIVIASYASYGAVQYMGDNSFCGLACHSVMAPQYAAFSQGAHSELDCIACHAGPGAEGFVRSKLTGIQQLVSLARGSYPRPIRMRGERKQAAREACTGCHSLAAQEADALRVFSKFSEDEANTSVKTVLVMRTGAAHRAHVGVIRMAMDPKGETIQWAETVAAGTKIRYSLPETGASLPARDMDCLDCHNRPAHVFESPERALEASMLRGSIPRDLPFAMKQSAELLRQEYASREDADRRIRESFAAYYKNAHPQVWSQRSEQIERAAGEVAAIYSRNVFPHMNIRWGTYANHLGHTASPGCFRCHDGGHLNPQGGSISPDCNQCHTLLAIDDPAPAVLRDFGIGPIK
jgi:hypothetical protein